MEVGREREKKKSFTLRQFVAKISSIMCAHTHAQTDAHMEPLVASKEDLTRARSTQTDAQSAHALSLTLRRSSSSRQG